MSHIPLIPLSQFPAQLRITSTRDHSSRHSQHKGHSNQLENFSRCERSLLTGEQVKRKPCLMLKADKQLTAPPGIFHHLIPPATSHSIHSSCWDFMVCSAPPNWAHSPHRKQGKRRSRLTSRTKVHPEERDIFSTKVLFLLALCLFRCFTELKQLGASDQDRSSIRGGGLPCDSALPLLVPPTTSHELASVKETVCAYRYEITGAPWLLLKCKSTNAFPSRQLFGESLSTHLCLRGLK